MNLQTKYCKLKQQIFSLYENKVNSEKRAIVTCLALFGLRAKMTS